MEVKSQNRIVQFFFNSPHLQKTLTLALDSTDFLTFNNLANWLTSTRNPSSSDFFFTIDGKLLNESTRIPVSKIPPFSTLILHPRVAGGGGDGGATGAESRDCYLKMYAEKKPDKVDPNEQRLSKWLNCALTNESLTEPCVVDRLGNIFNKEALVETLISKKLPKQFSHIKGLKDMVNVKLTMIPGTAELGDGDAYMPRFQCPISGFEFNGKYRFFALRGCGHVLSSKALKEVKTSSCLVCHKEFTDLDKIAINGSEEEVSVLRERMELEKANLREKKAAGKKGKNGELIVMNEGEGVDLSRVSGVKRATDLKKNLVKVASKVEGNEEKTEDGKSTAKRFKAVAPAHANKEVYASIFTSSRKSDFKETYSCRSLPLGRN